jgi:2-phospho-L-lactate guanylyltransferase (CobY/MobA/RfbA family)
MRVIAVPVKSAVQGQHAFAGAVPAERGALALAMLEDVLDATLAVPGWETWVVSPDEVALEVAARRGARPIPEDKPGLSAAIRQTEATALDAGTTALAVVPGDLPLLTAEVLTAAFRTLGPVVVCRSTRNGTSCCPPPPTHPPVSAPNPSVSAWNSRSPRPAGGVVERRELSFDLDVPDDILTLLAEGKQGRTREVCQEMDLAERLAVRA